nr:probable flavin-containing monooxygenase 1 [Tanacetum cinerariifolium]
MKDLKVWLNFVSYYAVSTDAGAWFIGHEIIFDVGCDYENLEASSISTYENENAHIFEYVYATEYIPLSRRGAGHESKGYESTVAGTSYRTLPYPNQLLGYLRPYATHFDLIIHIQFHSLVKEIDYQGRHRSRG